MMRGIVKRDQKIPDNESADWTTREDIQAADDTTWSCEGKSVPKTSEPRW